MVRLRQRLLAQSWWVKGSILAVAVTAPAVAATAVVALSNGGGKDTEPDRSVVVATVPVASRTPALPSATATSEVMPSETPLSTVMLSPTEPVSQQPVQVQQTPIPPAAPTEASTPPPTPPPNPAPTPAIDIGAICQTDATTVGDRVFSLYRAKGYPKGTYEGLSSEADIVYHDFCVQSSDARVDLYDFCYGVDAGPYFWHQAAGAEEWITDCLGHKFF